MWWCRHSLISVGRCEVVRVLYYYARDVATSLSGCSRKRCELSLCVLGIIKPEDDLRGSKHVASINTKYLVMLTFFSLNVNDATLQDVCMVCQSGEE